MKPTNAAQHAVLFAHLPLIRILADKHAPRGEFDDFCQELSCRLLGAVQRGVANPAAWLRITARNLAIDCCRALPRGVRHEDVDGVAEPTAAGPGPLELAAQAE